MVFRIENPLKDKWRVHHAVPGPPRTSVQIERLAERELSGVLSKNRSSQMMRRLALSFYLPVAAAAVVVVVVGDGIKPIRTKSSCQSDVWKSQKYNRTWVIFFFFF